MTTKRWLFLAFFVFVSAAVVFAEEGRLSREETIRVAAAKAAQLGYSVEKMDIVYDEGNRMLKKHLRREGVSTFNPKTNRFESELPTTAEREYPEVAGRDFQAVYLGPKPPQRGGDLWVFVDRKNGEVIRVVCGQ